MDLEIVSNGGVQQVSSRSAGEEGITVVVRMVQG